MTAIEIPGAVRVVAMVMAAGSGRRLGGEKPKQFLKIGGVPILRLAVSALLSHPGIGAVRVVSDPEQATAVSAALAGLEIGEPITGGAERDQSVRNGLSGIAELSPEIVLIHDAARPFIPHAVIDRVLAALEGAPGAIPALPVADTVKRVADDRISVTVPRQDLVRAQTPQGFRYQAILDAHAAAGGLGLTDDAGALEVAGLDVAVVAGDASLHKITTAEDLRMARMAHGQDEETRVGTGFDVHRFGPGDSVTLCGITVPHTVSLTGHSDADVGLHALTDALLGAIGDGDIGAHFPPSDPQWKGADSAAFLVEARRLVAARGGRIVNVDVTLICERPKIGPHRETMRKRVAEILGITVGRVSVKATTTEQLGFAGRGEGIAAQAAATVRLPAMIDGETGDV